MNMENTDVSVYFQYDENKWRHGIAILLAILYFFIPSGRFHIEVSGIAFTTGYDAFKLIPIPFVAWLVWRFRQSNTTRTTSNLLLPFTTLFLVSLISGMASSNSWQALADSLEILFYLFLVLMLVDFSWTPETMKYPAMGFVIGNLYLGSVVIQQFYAAKHAGEVVRLSGTFNHPNQLGAYAIVGFTLLIWLTQQIHNRAYSLWTWLAAITLVFATVTTQSRTALIALGVWGITVYWLGTPKMRKYVLILLASIFVIVLIFSPQIFSRFYALGDEIPDPNRVNRPLIWYSYLYNEIPTLPPFGVGMGPVSTYRFGDWIASNPETPSITRAWGPHNTYLAWLIGTGLTGLFVLAWFLKTAWDRIQRCASFDRAVLSAGFLAFLVTCLFQDPFLESNLPIAWITLIVLGDRLAMQETREESK